MREGENQQRGRRHRHNVERTEAIEMNVGCPSAGALRGLGGP